MPKLYERIETEEGDVRYEEAEAPDPEPRDLTDDEFRADPRYKEVLDESVGRRKRLGNVRDSAKELGIVVGQDGTLSRSKEKDGDKTDPPPPPPEPPEPLDENAMYERFRERMRKEDGERREQESQLNQEVSNLAKEHGLEGDEEAIAIIRGSRDRAKTAAVLGRRRVQLGEVIANGANDIKPANDIASNVARRLGITLDGNSDN